MADFVFLLRFARVTEVRHHLILHIKLIQHKTGKTRLTIAWFYSIRKFVFVIVNMTAKIIRTCHVQAFSK